MAKKETISPPTKKALKDGSGETRRGHSSGARTLADQSVAVREGVVKGKPKKK